jgi:UDP-glucuronate 4-epimerase
VKRILLTGAAGFIGSHVADALLARGDAVVGLDDLNGYYDPARKEANLAEVRAAAPEGRFEFVHGDVRDLPLIERLVAAHRPDVIVHLAAMAGVRASMDDPHLYYEVNLTGTLNLLEAARKNELPNFVFAGTSSVYGATEVLPFVETDPCDRPLAPYPASKRAAEMLGFTYHHLYGQSFTALRFFTVYGPRARPDMMAYKVLSNIFTGQEVPLYEGGNMKRDWTYVGDITQGVVRAVDRRLGYEIINLGRGEEMLLSDFVARVEQLAGRKANLKAEPKPRADVVETSADISKARRLLGYDPQVSVPEGTARFWKWYERAVLGR